MLLTLMCTCVAADAVELVEGPKICQQCPMERTFFPESRMLVVYEDGTRVGVCSIHCAAEELSKNKKKQVKVLLVADFTTKKLVDAKTSTWVAGGKKKGVMTFLAKWAFAREQDAHVFTKKYGGKVITFDQIMKLANSEVRSMRK